MSKPDDPDRVAGEESRSETAEGSSGSNAPAEQGDASMTESEPAVAEPAEAAPTVGLDAATTEGTAASALEATSGETPPSAARPSEAASAGTGEATPSGAAGGEEAKPPSGLRAAMGPGARVLSLTTLLAVAITVWATLAFGGKWVTPFLQSNDLPMPERMQFIRLVLGSAAAGALLGVVLLVLVWRKRIDLTALERLMWFLSPGLLLPFLPQIFRPKPWVNRQDVLVALVLAVALVAEVLFFQSLRVVPERITRLLERIRAKLPELWHKHGPLVVVLLAVTAYVVFMSVFNIRWHYKLKTHNFDLSIDNNLIYSALEGAHMHSTVTFGNKAGQYMATHAKLGQYVILPIYALYPRPETLMVIQSALLGLGALPLYGFARRYVSRWTAVVLALAYLAYYPLHSANFTESKYLSLSGFFVLSTFWAAERKKWVLFGLAFVCATLMREDVPIGLAMGGAFLLLSGHRPVAGTIMALVSTVWFVILRFVIMDRAGNWWFPEMYKGLWASGEPGFGSVIKTLLTNPLFVLNEILEREKLLYVLHLLVPLALLPARRWYLWLAFVPGTVLTLLATDYKPLHGYSFQYVMHWIPYLFLAAPLALAAIKRENEQGAVRLRAIVVAMGIASAALSYNYGAFAARNDSVKGGYFAIDFKITPEDRARYRDLMSVIEALPAEASVVASENVGPHVSSRKYMYALRRGVYDAEYMLAARNELDFEQTRRLFTDAVKTNTYGVVKRVGDFVLLKKGHDPSGNAQLIADWKL